MGRSCKTQQERSICGDVADVVYYSDRLSGVLPDLGLCSIADHLEGVRRFPNFSEKTVKFQAQKEHAQQTETGAKTKVNNWD